MRSLPIVLARLERKRIHVLNELHEELRERIQVVLEDLRFTPWEGYRDAIAQAKAKASGNSEANFGESPHNWRPSLAVDLVLHPSHVSVRAHPQDPSSPDLWDDESPDALAAWEALDRAAEQAGLERVTLKNRQRDRPHLQLPNWRSRIPH